jgi:diguanylate cyclase (GGDEF)-like protein
MLIPRTYRLRLIIYTSTLLVFVVAVLGFSYRASRALVLEQAEVNIGRVAQQIEGQLRSDARDAAARVKMIRDNVTLTEYLFITSTLNTDAAAVREMYQRQFGWLPVHRVLLLTRGGRALIGTGHRDLIEALRVRNAPRQPLDQQFYFFSRNELELVTAAGVSYRKQYLGEVAITTAIGTEWMAMARRMSNGHIIMAQDGKIIRTTLGDAWAGRDFAPVSNVLHAGTEQYLVRQIQLDGVDAGLPTLWFALSEAGLTQQLIQQRDRMLLLVVIGGAGILLIGFLILRNFSAPLGRLVAATHEVSAGRFPEFPESHSRDEIGFLWNQFASMVRRLRDKQEEVNKAHAQLERLATTDALTGLYNRHYLYEVFPKLHAEAQRQGKALTVILADVDSFKGINDRYGHAVGDQALMHLADVLRSCTRSSDFVFRTGGEEFLILVAGDAGGGNTLAEKIRVRLESTPMPCDGQSLRITASFGVAQTDVADIETASQDVLYAVTARADRMLYSAKQAGRNRVAAAG